MKKFKPSCFFSLPFFSFFIIILYFSYPLLDETQMAWQYTTVALRIDVGNTTSFDTDKDVETFSSSGILLKQDRESYVLSL